MRVLRGKVDCESTKVIPAGSKATVSIIDCCLCDAPSRTIAKLELSNVISFPFDYEIEYDETRINVNIAYGFCVAARINNNDQLEFINDTSHSIIKQQQLLDNLDVQVIQVQRF